MDSSRARLISSVLMLVLALHMSTLATAAFRQPASPDSTEVIVPPADKVPPGQPIVFTATEDIPPPYRVTSTISGDTIKIIVNGVLVRWMKSPSPHIEKVMNANRSAIAHTIENGGVQLFTPVGEMTFSPLCAKEVQDELHRARAGDTAYHYKYIKSDHVTAIARKARRERRQ